MADREENVIEAPHGTLQSYVVGFAIMVVLSAIAFVLVMTHVLPIGATIPIILVLAAVQIVSLLTGYVRLSRKADGGWPFLTAIYAVIVLLILVGGSVWIIYHLNQVNSVPGLH